MENAMQMIKSHVDLRELFRGTSDRFAPLFGEYMPLFEEAFPDEDEREDGDTYKGYFADDSFPWHMIALLGANGEVLGGIQYQVRGRFIWAEHIWLAPTARCYPNFRALLRIALEVWAETGAKLVFMEFNDRAKMSWAQLQADAEGGLATEDREKLWARLGLYVLHDRFGKLPVYWQSGMPTTGADGQPAQGAPVTYLSLGFFPLEMNEAGKPIDLEGTTMNVQEYLDLCMEAHETIPGVNRETDEAIGFYRPQLEAMIAAGETEFSFVRLADTAVERLVKRRFAPRPQDQVELAKTA
jgi:hypothetical protein